MEHDRRHHPRYGAERHYHDAEMRQLRELLRRLERLERIVRRMAAVILAPHPIEVELEVPVGPITETP